MNRYYSILIVLLLTINSFALPSWLPHKSNTQIGGYIKELPYLIFNDDNTQINNLIHFRTDFRWFTGNFVLEAGGRLQLYSGDAFSREGMNDSVSAIFGEDLGYVDLSDAWPSILYGNIDRAWIGLERGRLNVMLGRQRINWGTNLVWNPNDWYNTYNFIDFDYEERPGTDALHIQYFTSPVSVAELALEFGKDQDQRTFANMYKFNVNGYDLQIQAGLFELDVALGFSWAGSIYGGGFRGEIAYFHQIFDEGMNNFVGDDSSGNFVAAVSGDYTFANSLYLHGEVLYNGFGTNGDIFVKQTFEEQINAKSLLPSVFGIFAEAGYTFSPLVYGSISVSTNPADFSFYVSPNITWSVFQNLDMLVIAQLFFGRPNTLYGDTDELLAMRLRWSF